LPLVGHSEAISVVTFAPGGTFFASGARDRTVRIWDLATGDAMLELVPTNIDSSIATLTFSADDALLIGLAMDEAKFHSYSASSVNVPPVGTSTVSGLAVSVNVWSSPSFPTPELSNSLCGLAMTFSTTTNRVAILLLDNKIQIYDMVSHTANGSVLEIPRGHTSTIINQLVFSPTGRWIAATFRFRPNVFMWDVQDGTLAWLSSAFGAHSLAFSPDGSQIASGSLGGPIDIWNLSSQSVVMKLNGHSQKVRAMSYSLDGNHVISGSNDETLRVWDLRSEITSSAQADEGDSSVHSVAFSPDGSCCVVAAPLRLEAWLSSTSLIISSISLEKYVEIVAVSFSPSGDHVIAVSRHELYVWDLDKTITPISIYERPDSTKPTIFGIPVSVAVSCTGAHVAVHVHDFNNEHHYLLIWDWKTSTPNKTTPRSMVHIFEPTIESHHRRRLSISTYLLACSPDGSKVVLGWGEDMEVIDGTTGAVIQTLHVNGGPWITTISFSPDGSRIISGTDTGKLCQYDMKAGLMHDLVQVDDDPISSLVFSPDGTHVISRSRSHQFVVHAHTLLPVDVDAVALPTIDKRTASSLHLLRNGWVVDLKNKPIFWVPAENRAYGWRSAAYGSQILLGGLTLTWIDVSDVNYN
jgi:WD40 repeat protein